jgi:hypothetical protein
MSNILRDHRFCTLQVLYLHHQALDLYVRSRSCTCITRRWNRNIERDVVKPFNVCLCFWMSKDAPEKQYIAIVSLRARCIGLKCARSSSMSLSARWARESQLSRCFVWRSSSKSRWRLRWSPSSCAAPRLSPWLGLNATRQPGERREEHGEGELPLRTRC